MKMRRKTEKGAALLCAVMLMSAGDLCSQTVHTVTLSDGLTFSPSSLTIDVSDTVDWVWTGIMEHNVVSGVSGIPDGSFSSGVSVFAPNTFSVTFDQAFLTANPMPGNAYPYYCDPHVFFGMTGTVTVQVPPAVPALPPWGVVVMALTLLAGTIFLLLRRKAAPV